MSYQRNIEFFVDTPFTNLVGPFYNLLPIKYHTYLKKNVGTAFLSIFVELLFNYASIHGFGPD